MCSIISKEYVLRTISNLETTVEYPSPKFSFMLFIKREYSFAPKESTVTLKEKERLEDLSQSSRDSFLQSNMIEKHPKFERKSQAFHFQKLRCDLRYLLFLQFLGAYFACVYLLSLSYAPIWFWVSGRAAACVRVSFGTYVQFGALEPTHVKRCTLNFSGWILGQRRAWQKVSLA